MEIRDKKVTVIGAGKSGIAASELLIKNGARVFLSEHESTVKDEKRLNELTVTGLEYELGGHTDRVFNFPDFFVISPGVDPSIDIIRKAKQKGIPVYSELEAAYWFCKSPIIAVTGSNGKTTTTALLGKIFEYSGKPVFVGGNIGNPFSGIAEKTNGNGYVILEVSSFQLEAIEKFKPFISVILNISPDHLDRYASYEDYIEAKFRILENMTAVDYLVYYYDDPVIKERIKNIIIKKVPYSLDSYFRTGAFKTGRELKYYSKGSEKFSVNTDAITIKGIHNEQNVLASISVSKLCEIENEHIYRALREFQGIEHRMEVVGEIEGTVFINDSKATNIDSVYYALKSVTAPVILIAGGKDKKSDLTKINSLLKEKVKLLILLGEAADRMESVWKNYAEYVKTSSFEDAVREAWNNSVAGDTILLSPACSSFDMFNNYEERGRTFKEIFGRIKSEKWKKKEQ